jgi:hypothetical protein
MYNNRKSPQVFCRSMGLFVIMLTRPWNISHGFCPAAEPMPLAPPNYRVRLFHGNSTITSRIYHTLQASLHSNSGTCQAQGLLANISFSPHKLGRSWALLLPFSQEWQNPRLKNKNHLYCSISPLCPCYMMEEETFLHVLSFQEKSAAAHQISDVLRWSTKITDSRSQYWTLCITALITG